MDPALKMSAGATPKSHAKSCERDLKRKYNDSIKQEMIEKLQNMQNLQLFL